MHQIVSIDLAEAIESKIDRSKWRLIKFSDLVENIVEKVVPKDSGLKLYIGLEHLDSGSLHIKRFGETESLVGDKLKIYKGDIIFAKRNAYLKRVAIAEFDAVVSAHSMVLRAKTQNVLPEFLPLFMLSEAFWQRAIEISVGSLSPTINWKVLAKQEFLLPPKDQQARIAELLWSGDEMIEKAIVTLESLTANRYTFFEREMEANINQVTTLGRVITNITAGKSPMGESRCANDNEYGVLKVSAVGNEEYVESENKALLNQKQFDKKFEVKPGYILVTRANALLSGIGRACIVNGTRTGLMLSDKTLRIIPNPDRIKDRFLYQCLLSRLYRNYVESMAGGTDAKNISQGQLRNAPIWKPSLEVQNTIEKKLLAYDDSINRIKEFIQTSKALQKSLINQFF